MRSRKRALAVVLVCACNKTAAVVDAAPAASASASVAASAVVKPVAVPKPIGDVVSVVRAWNDATNAHDGAKLGALYADDVELYGTRVPRAKAVAIKEAAFAKHDRDELESIAVTSHRATFRKKSKGKDGKVIDVTGYLDVDAAMKITAEGDTTTDANLARGKENRCAAAVQALVESTTDGKAAKTDTCVVEPTGGAWTVKYITVFPGGQPVGDGLVTGMIIHGALFRVDPSAGTVINEGGVLNYSDTTTGSYTNADAGPLATDAAAAARVRAACATQ